MLHIENLFPESRKSWMIWFFLVVGLFPLYYRWVYPHIANYYGKSQWSECEVGRTLCSASDSQNRWQVLVRVPRYVAGFTEMPVEIQVENVYTPSQRLDTAVTILGVTPDGSTLQGVDVRSMESAIESAVPAPEPARGSLRNSVILSEIPHYGQASAIFMVRAVSPRPPRFGYQIFLDGEGIFQKANLVSEYNPPRVLQLLLLRYFLLPPGSNFFIPLVLLLYIGYIEFWYYPKGEHREVVLILAFISVIVAGVSLGLNVKWVLLTMLFILIPPGYHWWRNRKEKRDRAGGDGQPGTEDGGDVPEVNGFSHTDVPAPLRSPDEQSA